MKIRSRGLFFLAAVTAVQFGCGGGGGGGGGGPAPVVQPTKAIVRLSTAGTLPAGTLIGGIDATVTYSTTKGLSITASDVVTSGAAAGASSFLQANVNNPGQVRLALINVSPGVAAGEFATLTFSIASGNSPIAGDFAIAPGASVIDTNSAALSGFTVTISNVSFQ